MPKTAMYPESVHAALHALILSLGTPVRTPVVVDNGGTALGGWGQGGLLLGATDSNNHPVFGLLEHFESHDQGNHGYTQNSCRGDHLTVPCFTEDGGVFILEISFHKGDTYVERIDFPSASENLVRAAHSLLESCETR